MFKHIARRALFRKQIAGAQFLAQRRFGHFTLTFLYVLLKLVKVVATTTANKHEGEDP